ncbi:MAG TPA: tRNA preQ1(34) S-adenosylmethionine ribosyltransferase-isomerase QueA [Vicinamibacterales bacterium]|jgi:S-adenosylmethionine:tRNA ribosyltransferase-isomerase
MDVSDFDFELPPELIAQEPPAERGTSRLLALDRASGAIADRRITDLPDLLAPGDLLVVNNTRVFPARLLGHRVPSGGRVECLLIRRVDGDVWEALVHPGQKLKPGARLRLGDAPALHGEVLDRLFYGRRRVRLWTDDERGVEAVIEAIGHVPLPPYIHRADLAADRERYQTVYARQQGSVAAPTAGLHFTEPLLRAMAGRGVERVEITLHVGYGTFQPVRVTQVEEHRVEPERYEIDERAAAVINRAVDEGRRVIAVGTTTTRTLEGVAAVNGGRIVAGRGETGLFIYPGFRFQVLGGLITNFHLPCSSLLMLVSAFAGRQRVLGAYHWAIDHKYRFYSYGDAMLCL